mmetsp:Transcript_26313/g.28318  ORF Transcript_26313/g.28318 Transcript_26313/m.28318 type:complete len:119 (+) Transcript_26313:44-400(+)
MWQFRNQVLHSPIGPTSIASYHSLHYQISKDKHTETDSVNRSNYHLFSILYTITKLNSSSIKDKKLWLEFVCLARKEDEKPDSEIIHQATSMRNQMQSFLITNDPFLPVIQRERPVAM